MSALTAVPSPAQVPAARQNEGLHLQPRALNGIKRHLLSGGTDNEFMLRLAANALHAVRMPARVPILLQLGCSSLARETRSTHRFPAGRDAVAVWFGVYAQLLGAACIALSAGSCPTVPRGGYVAGGAAGVG